MTCLYMIVKTLGPSKKLSISALIDMSRGYYCAEDITETELDILPSCNGESLDRRHSPLFRNSHQSFLRFRMTSWIPARELCEMAVMDEYFVSYKSSSIAAAVVLTASRQHGLSEEQVKSHVNDWMKVDMDQVSSLCQHFETMTLLANVNKSHTIILL